MTTFYQRLLRGGKQATGSAEPRLALAAFGKHPGWDDYLGGGVDTGIGVDTGTLAHVKHAVHTEGIRGQIDSGAWEKLEPEKRLEEFDHAFLWLRAGHVILGQISSSTDGKRRRYPMVLCIDAEGVPPEFLLAKARPELKRLRVACQAATTAEQVTTEFRAAQGRLRIVLTESAEKDSETLLPVQARRRFLTHPALGPERLGMLRALHELGTAPGLLSNGGRRESGVRAHARTCHLRLPLASDLRNEGLSLWAAFLRCAIPDTVPLLLISRSGMDWIDVVIGETASDDFFWLQASLKASPLTTEIPFEISPNLKARLDQLEGRFLGAEPPTAAGAPPPAAKTAPPGPAPVPVDSPGREPPAWRKGSVLWVGGGMALVLAAAWLFWLGRGKVSTLVVGPDSKTRPYGAANPEFTRKLIGLRKGDGITVAYKTTADARSSIGRYDIVPVLNDPQRKLSHYRVTTNKSVLTITPVALTVTASNQSRAYGSINPPLTGSIQGLQNNDGITLTCRTKADAKSAVGDYDIVPEINDPTKKSGNYMVTTNKGTLTITPAAFSVKANDQTCAYRAGIPPLTVSIKGLRSGDGITAVGSAKAGTDSPVGGYDIVPELHDPGNKLGNYVVKTDNGILRITRVALSVTASNQSRVFGTANPLLTGWITPNADGISATYSTTAVPNSPPGKYKIEPRLSDPKNKQSNYTLTTREGWLTVTPAAVTAAVAVPVKPAGDVSNTLTNKIGMEFVWIADVPGGGAYVGKYEVTQEQYNKLMTNFPPAVGSNNLPVANVTFQDAQEFCRRLTAQDGKTYALPSHDEWLAVAQLSENEVTNAWNEISNRGMLQREVTSSGQNQDRNGPESVGSRGAQTNGICDLFGNVREWVIGKGEDPNVRDERVGFSYCSRSGWRNQLILPQGVEEETGFRCIHRK